MKTKLRRFCLLLPLVAVIGNLPAQAPEQIIVNPADSISGQYFVSKPAESPFRGVVVLLAGFGQLPQSIFIESKIPEAAAARGLLAVGVGMGPKLYADSAVIARIDAVLRDVKTRFAVPADRFVLGGYSAGGSIALRYAEYCLERPADFPVAPCAVFAVDAPVDLFDLWRYFDREIARDYSEAGMNEANTAQAIMQREHGSPVTNPRQYAVLTPFEAGRDGAGNARHLKSIPVRVYHDVDVNWYLANRRRSLYDVNWLNSSELINRLLLLGNDRAEFVAGRTGYRANGMRHPHSWSIVDEAEFLDWVVKALPE